MRRFYKTTFVVEILSEDLVPDEYDLKDCLEEAETGAYSGDVKSMESVEVSGPEMAKLLAEQRSDPGFFGLTNDGQDIEEIKRVQEMEYDLALSVRLLAKLRGFCLSPATSGLKTNDLREVERLVLCWGKDEDETPAL